MRAMQRSAVLIGIAAAMACSDGTSSSRFPESGVSPSAQWSGGVVLAHSAGFSGATVPALYAAGGALSVLRIDDTTLRVTLPVAPSGDLVISRSASGHDTVGVVQIAGFDRSRSVTGTMGFEPLAPEGVGGTYFVGQGPGAPVDTSLAILDPGTDQVTYLTGLEPVEEGFGVQPSYQANRFVLRDSTGLLGDWRLFPTPQFLDTAGVQAAARHITQLNDTTWLATFDHGYWVTTPSGTYSNPQLLYNPLRLTFSPNGQRLAFAAPAVQALGAPVFAVPSGDTVFTYSGIVPAGAIFSRFADELFSSVTVQAGVDTLLAIRASDGVRIGAVPLPAGYRGFALAADAKVNRLYQVAESSGTQALLVYDGATLGMVGRLRCAGACGNTEVWSAGVAIDTVSNKIHVAFPGSPIPIITYDRLP